MADPIIDVLIPVYNGAQTIRESLNSIRAQTVREIRIIVVDDGSTDSTSIILAELASEDSRIEIIRKVNGGIVEALNLGLQHCRAEFVARFDADDIAYHNRMDAQLNYMRHHPECVAVSGMVDHIDDHGRIIKGVPLPGPPDHADPTAIPASEPYLIHPFLMARRAALQAIGGYRFVHNSEDSDLYWRLLEQGRLHNLETSLGQYRIHKSSISGTSIIYGRVMAVSCQLAAVSARRRQDQKSDINFERADRERYYAARTLEGIYEIARNGLDEGEAAYLRIAATAKLLEMSNYRPYELERTDCLFIRSILKEVNKLPQKTRAEFYWLLTVVAARLVRRGHFANAAILAPVGAYPAIAYRMVGKIFRLNP